MAAILTLHALLLGEVPPQEPEPPPQTCRTEEPLTVSPQAKPEHDNTPILMWDPTAGKTPAACKLCPPAKLLVSPKLAVVKDIIDEFAAPSQPIVVKCIAHG
jgi:hypothetical protein